MPKLIACVFHSSSAAQAARQDLLVEGYKDEQIQIHGAATPAHDDASPNREGDDVSKVVEQIFNGLIPDAAETARYVKAVNDGKYVLALHVADDEAAAQAADILRAAGGTPATAAESQLSESAPRIYALKHTPTNWSAHS